MTAKTDILAFAEHPIAFYAVFARIAGRAANGVFLSQLFYWTGKSSAPGRWIWKSQRDWENETTLTRYEQETARKALKDIGLLEERRAGLPARMYYRLNLERLAELCEQDSEKQHPSVPESNEPVCGNPPNSDDGLPPSISETTTETTSDNSSAPSGHEAVAQIEDVPPHGAYYTVLKEVCKLDARVKSNRGRLNRCGKEYRDAGYDPELIRKRFGKGGWWYTHWWQGKKEAQPPIPEDIGKHWLEAEEAMPAKVKPKKQTITIRDPFTGQVEQVEAYL